MCSGLRTRPPEDLLPELSPESVDREIDQMAATIAVVKPTADLL